MCRIDERPCFKHENPFLPAEALGKIVRQHATADAGADDDDIEVVPRPEVLKKQPLL